MRTQLSALDKHPLIAIAAILIMAITVQASLVKHVTSNSGLILIEEAWRLSERLSELPSTTGNVAYLNGLSRALTELRAEQGIFQLLHIAPFAASFLIAEVSEATSYVFQVLISAISILLIYWLGRSLHSQKMGLMAAFLWSLFPLAIDYTATTLFTPFYFSLVLASIVFFLQGQNEYWWPGYIVSFAAVTICILAIPVLGLGLLILIALARIYAQPGSVEAKRRLAEWLLILLALGIILALLGSNLISNLTWDLYTSLLQRRESLFLFPMLFFALGWISKAPWWPKAMLIFALGLAYIVNIGLQLWPPNHTIIAENIEGLGSLLLLLPLIFLTAYFLTIERTLRQIQLFIYLVASFIILVSILYGQLGQASEASELFLNILQITAGISFFALLTLPWLTSPSSSHWKRVGVDTTIFLLSLSLLYYTALQSTQKNSLNENALVAADRVEEFLGLRDIYVCPDELGNRIWYLQGFKDPTLDSETIEENPYKPFPREIERREQGVLIIGDQCPLEVSSLFEIRIPETIGEDIATRILIFYVPGN